MGGEKLGGLGRYRIYTDINSKILGLAKTPPLVYFRIPISDGEILNETSRNYHRYNRTRRIISS